MFQAQLVHQPNSWIEGFHHDGGQVVWCSPHLRVYWPEIHNTKQKEGGSVADYCTRMETVFAAHPGHKLRCYRCEGFGHISRDCATPWTEKREGQDQGDSWPHAPPQGLFVHSPGLLLMQPQESVVADQHIEQQTQTHILKHSHKYTYGIDCWRGDIGYQQCLIPCGLEANLILGLQRVQLLLLFSQSQLLDNVKDIVHLTQRLLKALLLSSITHRARCHCGLYRQGGGVTW